MNWLRSPLLEGEPGAAGGGGNLPPAAGDPPAFAPSFDGVIQADGAFAEGWTSKAFGPDYTGPLAGVKTLTDVDKVLRDNMAAARAKTDGMLKVPGESATPEERAAFFKAIGVPDDPNGYGLAKPEKLPDGVSWDDAFAGEFAKTAHSLGLTPAQVKGLSEFQTQHIAGQVAMTRQQLAEADKAEKAELAKAFGGDATAVNAAVAAAQKVGQQAGLPPEAFDPQHQDYWGNQALQAFAKLAPRLGEHGFAPGSGGASAGAISVDAAKDIMNNKGNPDHAKYWAGDKDTVAKVQAAYKAATGGK